MELTDHLTIPPSSACWSFLSVFKFDLCLYPPSLEPHQSYQFRKKRFKTLCKQAILPMKQILLQHLGEERGGRSFIYNWVYPLRNEGAKSK
mmetsp:Transcript_13964/g.20849  ORF Transcript_13964/g.20849 Transcript_13964/m.20849 type:complete len:91 (+) Transcript_13964:644-916(+)